MPLTGRSFLCAFNNFTADNRLAMRDDYLKEALKVIPDPNLLINVVSPDIPPGTDVMQVAKLPQ